MQDEKMEMPSSMLKIYSLGVAAANIVFGQKELEVTPIEDFSEMDGELTDAQFDLESKGVDKDNNAYETKVKTSNALKALWLPLNLNRPFPGLIRRGERVLLWRVGDTDRYYFSELGIDEKVRRTDIFTLLIPNSSKEGEDSLTPDTAWFIEVNTVDKHITVQTNKNDGEEFAYLFQLNAKGGNFTVADDVGNYIQLDSTVDSITMENREGSTVQIKGGKGLFKTTESIDIETQTLNVKANTINEKASSLTSNISNMSFKGNGTWSGNMGYSGGTLTHNGANVGATHYHIGDSGGKTSVPA